MGDVKDILGLARGSGALPDAKDKPKEAKQERPKGLSREAYNLLYGTHPIAPDNLLKEIARKDDDKPAPASVQITYAFLPFRNEARSDGLKLHHWVRCHKDAAGRTLPADDGEYPYAKYNRSAGVQRYDDVEYETVVRPKHPEHETGWSKAETDYLLDLCERLDLRFLVIADRYAFPGGPRRTAEDLKARYYAIAYELVVARAGSRELAANSVIVRHPYDVQKERERKELLAMSLTRTPQQAADEDRILVQAEAIMQQRKEQAAAKRTQGAPFLHPATFSNSVSELPFFDHHVMPVAPPKPGLYLRRAMLEEACKKAVQQQPQSQRVQKTLDAVLANTANVAALPTMMTRAASGMYLSLFSEALHLVDLRHKAGARTGIRVADDIGRGKRPLKVKAPRYDDPAATGAMKRQRR